MAYSYHKDHGDGYRVCSHHAYKGHTVAVCRDETAAQLIVATKNYRSRSAAEWVQLRQARDRVADIYWVSRVSPCSTHGLITDNRGDWLISVYQLDGSDIRVEHRFIENVRSKATDLLNQTAPNLFSELEDTEGEELVLATEDLRYIGHLTPLTLRYGHVLTQYGDLLANHLLDHPLENYECVAYKDRNPRNCYKANLMRTDQQCATSSSCHGCEGEAVYPNQTTREFAFEKKCTTLPDKTAYVPPNSAFAS